MFKTFQPLLSSQFLRHLATWQIQMNPCRSRYQFWKLDFTEIRYGHLTSVHSITFIHPTFFCFNVCLLSTFNQMSLLFGTTSLTWNLEGNWWKLIFVFLLCLSSELIVEKTKSNHDLILNSKELTVWIPEILIVLHSPLVFQKWKDYEALLFILNSKPWILKSVDMQVVVNTADWGVVPSLFNDVRLFLVFRWYWWLSSKRRICPYSKFSKLLLHRLLLSRGFVFNFFVFWIKVGINVPNWWKKCNFSRSEFRLLVETLLHWFRRLPVSL